jgi:class II lanthipeptide synthase
MSSDTKMDQSLNFTTVLEHLTSSACLGLKARISQINGIEEGERKIILDAAFEAIQNNAKLKLNRVLLLELHAAKRCDELHGNGDSEKFIDFIKKCLTEEFVDHLQRRYPTFLDRFNKALYNHCRAIETFARRFASDRVHFKRLMHDELGALVGIEFGEGDLHSGGEAVIRLSFERENLMYKPRSLRIDAELDAFLAAVFGETMHRVCVPAVIDKVDYGWAAFIPHKYCQNEDDLKLFYKRLGHWLAVLRLLGGTDIHLENLIASGSVPVIIDVETMFAPPVEIVASGYGGAFDKAQALICGSVLRTGIVPLRGPALGFEGVDLSAAGALPGQQPQIHAPIIVDDGTTNARLQVVNIDVAQSKNHPDPHPNVSKFWDEISSGFLEATFRLRQLDDHEQLLDLLLCFEGCRVRHVRRTTQAYVEIGRMLWHPASLHDEPTAVERARDLLARNAAIVQVAPSDPAEIATEINDLLHGDIPIFVSPLTRSRIDAVLTDWRAMRADVEELTIRSALVATDLNQRMRYKDEERAGKLYAARRPRKTNLDDRRRTAAAAAVHKLLRLAVRGADGSVTWITPEISRSGWIVQPVQPDLYFGLGGIVVALAGYRDEVGQGRVDAMHDLDDTLCGARHTLVTMENEQKPDLFGGFSGHGARIWVWLTLYELDRKPQTLARAIAHAEALERVGFDVDQEFDIVDGCAGAIVPLLGLAEATADERWLRLAALAGSRLVEAAIVDDRGAGWAFLSGTEDPIGGFAHGAAGIAWALSRLELAGAGNKTERDHWRALAAAAFSFQDSLFDTTAGNWLDIRKTEGGESFPTWCHGSVGIGLVATDLYARTRRPEHLRTLRRAFANANGKWGSSHTLCHGDLSLWEFLSRASRLDPDVCVYDFDESGAQIVSSIEEHRGMVGGLTRAAFTPGLMTGIAGAIHGLCRLHPESKLPSPLLLEHMNHSYHVDRSIDQECVRHEPGKVAA